MQPNLGHKIKILLNGWPLFGNLDTLSAVGISRLNLNGHVNRMGSKRSKSGI